ncbi:hypothetical protein ACFX1T_024562 [Malus domestica]
MWAEGKGCMGQGPAGASLVDARENKTQPMGWHWVRMGAQPQKGWCYSCEPILQDRHEVSGLAEVSSRLRPGGCFHSDGAVVCHPISNPFFLFKIL